MNHVLSFFDLLQALESGETRVIVASLHGRTIWIRAITDADLAASDPEIVDYHSIVEMGGGFEVGGDTAYLRWSPTIDGAYAIALEIAGRFERSEA